MPREESCPGEQTLLAGAEEGRKGPCVREGFVSAPAQVSVSGGMKAALSSLLVTAGRPDHISTRSVRSLTHFETFQINAQACLKDRFWCLPVTRIGIERNKEFTARGKNPIFRLVPQNEIH